MTKYVVFDVETTGLTKCDEVIQFCCIIIPEDKSLGVKEKMINFYCDTQATIDAGALNVHHIDKNKLHLLSQGQFFEDSWLPLADSLREHKVIWIDWSMGGFDERLVNQTLVNNGLEDYFHFPRFASFEECYKHRFSCFDLMRALCQQLGRRSLKLSDAVRTLPYDRDKINRIYLANASRLSNFDGEMRFHNAAYDAFLTRLLLKHYFSI